MKSFFTIIDQNIAEFYDKHILQPIVLIFFKLCMLKLPPPPRSLDTAEGPINSVDCTLGYKAHVGRRTCI